MDGLDRTLYQSTYQINGTAAHDAVDNGRYSTRSNVIQGIEVYSEKYGLIGKIDSFDIKSGTLTERKKHISKIYDGQIFQLYAQYFGLIESGYSVNVLRLYSMDDNKMYRVDLPDVNPEYYSKFVKVIESMKSFDVSKYIQDNVDKCMNCIYNPICASSAYYDDKT